MKKTKSSKKQSLQSTNVETVEHYNAVLLESLKADFRFVIEAVQGLDQKMERRFAEMEERFNTRFEVLELTLKRHSTILDHHSTILNHHSSILDRHSSILEEQNRKLERLDQRLGGVCSVVKIHDKKLKRLCA